MKSTAVPMICGVALAAISAAGASHWWSVRQFVSVMDARSPVLSTPLPGDATPPPAEQPLAKTAAPATTVAANPPQPKPSATPAVSGSQKEFYEALLAEVKNLRTENLNLVDQMAETNRDLMKLEFRVDTHSESFRPMPTSEDRPDTTLDTTFDEGTGVLPPRAEPVYPLSHE